MTEYLQKEKLEIERRTKFKFLSGFSLCILSTAMMIISGGDQLMTPAITVGFLGIILISTSKTGFLR
jgi:hypothetical protein